jgi:threonine dehydratase
LSRGTDTHTALAIFACEPAGALDAMDSGKQNRIVPLSIPNTLADGLRTSLGELTLPILCRHVTGFFAVTEEKFYRQCNSPRHDSSL